MIVSSKLNLFLVACLVFLSAISEKIFAQTSLSFPVISLNSFLSEQQLETLSQSREWHNILHFKNGKSEIDDPKFFLSDEGKFDSKKELIATIDALLNDKKDNNNSIFCRYPSRSNWIFSKISELKNVVSLTSCSELNQELSLLQAESVTLILASAHINSPASAFGHTFLRLDTAQKTPLTAYAINYAAQTNETNGLIYAYKGLFGGYEGRYSILPYSKKIQEYGHMEQRDIWEYSLNLDQEEVERLVLHIMEQRHFFADYFFLSENCSYNLLWLLQVARPSLELTDRFNYTAIPIDTLKAIEAEGVILAETYRPSNQNKMEAYTPHIKSPEAVKFSKGTSYELESINGLTNEEQVAALELAVFNLKLNRTKNRLDHPTYTKQLLHLLRARSQFSETLDLNINKPVTPLLGHDSARFAFGIQTIENKQYLTLGIKPSYHDTQDVSTGYLSGAYINFFDTQLSFRHDSVQLESLHFIDIKSYAQRTSLFKPISWQVSLGLDRKFDDKLGGFIKPGAGLTFGNSTYYSYMMAVLGAQAHGQTRISAEAHLGVIFQYEKTKFGLKTETAWFHTDEQREEWEAFFTFQATSSLAFNTNFQQASQALKNKQNKLSLNLFYYF
ncbi:DUF4105 domain-containing protein [Thiomicrospira microaerophila]|uniref:Lnb N-terminal periplasmic domain-containing protein n=1 Tax=Thiomicrospira microaerophila TaxID=406020 RepID=UPI00200D668F|nr:DUF4105 domain-containing protein [Thiomicrospira microaerophila]UQB43005.1 DUF4105 domain-containing protein [Thiomicrospira microaerophila]